MHSSSLTVSRFSNLSDHHHLHRGSCIRHPPSHSPPPPPSHLPKTQILRLRRNFQISAIDTAQPFDNDSKMSDHIAKSKPLKIAVVGFGNFGQFLAKSLARQGHTVLAHSRTDYSAVAAELGVYFYSNADDLCEEHPEVILLCTSILSTDKVLRSLPLQRLKRSTLFVDVLSVKEFAKDLFLQILPPHFDILCTHPMFGPESGKHSWKDLPFVYDKVRIGHDEARVSRCQRFLDSFAKEGCIMMEMGCAEHDQHAAESQFITHTVGRILEKLDLYSTPINTKGYEKLLDLVDNTSSDSFELYYGLFMYNKNAMEQLERLDLAFEWLKKELFGHLHEVLRNQSFGLGGRHLGFSHEAPVLSKLPRNGNGNKLSLNRNGNGNGLSLNGNGNGNRNENKLSFKGHENVNGLSLNKNRNENGLSLNGNGNGSKLSLNGNGNESKLSFNRNENGNKNKLSFNENENENDNKLYPNRNQNDNGKGNKVPPNGNENENGNGNGMLHLNGNGNGKTLALRS
ncbi:arogenate dehydrogenase 2, chloroplastic-like [Cynara cardunculus var. scolymus]|uniref:NAD(P)-binding domain-containing protein n=1 Tax=Cynara cardunculus var. scolymus TaxID=59895 RepID=A0A103Y2J8_CYNCS|nr:arogenate dehydrogenase 2, chloroplastic-like [Cynara cardunculus var. scolymus]KVI01326.1 NAD(P)-binding domain-containing protein [Cynara cardunculus var. scolymus]